MNGHDPWAVVVDGPLHKGLQCDLASDKCSGADFVRMFRVEVALQEVLELRADHVLHVEGNPFLRVWRAGKGPRSD